MISTNFRRVALVLFAGAALSACSQSSLRISPDFGNALNQDVAGQIADPDARYVGVPAPGSNGDRVGLAQKRYQTGTVIPPSTVSASGTASGSGGNNGGGGNGSGGGAGAAAGATN